MQKVQSAFPRRKGKNSFSDLFSVLCQRVRCQKPKINYMEKLEVSNRSFHLQCCSLFYQLLDFISLPHSRPFPPKSSAHCADTENADLGRGKQTNQGQKSSHSAQFTQHQHLLTARAAQPLTTEPNPSQQPHLKQSTKFKSVESIFGRKRAKQEGRIFPY